MAGMLINSGEARMLRLLCNTSTSLDTLWMHLFKNDTTPLEADTSGSYDMATFGGYASVIMTGSSWTVSSAATSGTTAVAPQQTFSCTSATSESIYGYYFTSGSGLAQVVAAERFSAGPFVIQSSGDQVKVTPTIALE